MGLSTALLSALLSLPTYHEDRSAPEAKRVQLETVTRAIVTVTAEPPYSNRWRAIELSALLVAVARHETTLSLRIHAGDCKPHECDRGKARGLWQMHERAASSPEAWQALPGLSYGSTLHATREAARALTRARGYCKSLERGGDSWLPHTLSAYAGRGCVGDFKGRDLRISTYRQIVRKLARPAS